MIILAQKYLVLKQEKLKREWSIDPNKFIILMPGRLTYWKGQEKIY